MIDVVTWAAVQIGGTVWIVPAGLAFAPDDPGMAGFLMLCGVVPNLFGIHLWRCRQQLGSYHALSSLVIVMAGLALVALAGLLQTGHSAPRAAWVDPLRLAVGMVIVYAAVLFLLRTLDARSRRRSAVRYPALRPRRDDKAA